MAIVFKCQRRRNFRNCRATLVCRKPVLLDVNRNTNRDATLEQDDFPRVTMAFPLDPVGSTAL